MVKRDDPLMLGLTTAGAKKDGLWWDLDKDGQRTLEGLIEDDSAFYFIARLDEDDAWDDESCWQKPNPNLDVSVDREKLRINCKRAKNNPSYLNEFKRKHLNLPAEGETAWIPIDLWDACTSDVRLDQMERGAKCVVAIDVSAIHDFTAATAVFPLSDDRYFAHTRLWIPEGSVIDRVKNDKVPVNVWVDRGFVHTTDGETIDQDCVKQWLLDLRERFDVREVPADPYQAWKLLSELDALGFETVQHRQGFLSMGPAMKETELLIRGTSDHSETKKPSRIHDGNPAMRWMMGNVSVSMDPAGNIKPNKDKSGDRIDGPVSLIMAVGRVVVHQGSGTAPLVYAM